MPWTIEKLPNFIALDSAEMVAELLVFQFNAMRQGVTDTEAYADVYARVFGANDPAAWIYRPPAEVAHGITTIVREVGLFVLLDDATALSALYTQASWQTKLPAVRVSRPGPIYTKTRQQQITNRRAIELLIHRAAALAFAERLPSVRFAALPTSLRVRDVVSAMFGAVIAESSAANDGTARMLHRLRTSLWQLIDARSTTPQEDGVLITTSPLPSLVCAHYAYREARQAHRIRTVNLTAHPTFMPNELRIPAWP